MKKSTRNLALALTFFLSAPLLRAEQTGTNPHPIGHMELLDAVLMVFSVVAL